MTHSIDTYETDRIKECPAPKIARIPFGLLATAAALGAVVPANAQSTDGGLDTFGIEPYVGVMGVINDFDSEVHDSGIPNRFGGDGREIDGVAGVNVPLGPLFVGVEGNVAKGIGGDIDWEYGVSGRAGARIGESGLIYGRLGYQWVNFDSFGADSPDFHDIQYGLGVEVGPGDIGLGGLTGNSGMRLRGEIQTFGDFESLRPSVGIVFPF